LDTAEFDFDLPEELIAQQPVEPRDRSRLLVVRRRQQSWEHRHFADLPELLESGDVVVRNVTKVVPARLVGQREETRGKWEGLFLSARPDGSWELLATTRGKPRVGETVVVGDGLRLRLEDKSDEGHWIVRPEAQGAPFELLERHGQVPLPPYIHKGQAGPNDRERYQTLFATVPGAVAAPTAGLHFTHELLDRLGARWISCVDATLHVGLGTFKPIETERIEDHVMHAEHGELPASAATALNNCRARGSRVVAIGTTIARLLETSVSADGTFQPFVGETAIYLHPGHVFRGLDALITNFHLPRSSLLVLVSAFAGTDLVRAVYEEAIRERYRFYGYGDAMLIL
jgi:S-adenosylmethionine:tRNA ribosyltransferase-isomerase